MVDGTQQPLRLPQPHQVGTADLPSVLSLEENSPVDEEYAEKARVLLVAAAQQGRDSLGRLLADPTGGHALRRRALEIAGKGQQIASQRLECLAALTALRGDGE